MNRWTTLPPSTLYIATKIVALATKNCNMRPYFHMHSPFATKKISKLSPGISILILTKPTFYDDNSKTHAYQNTVCSIHNGRFMKRSWTGYVPIRTVSTCHFPVIVGITERWKMQLKFDSIVAPEHNFWHRHSAFLMSHGDTMRSMIIFDGRL